VIDIHQAIVKLATPVFVVSMLVILVHGFQGAYGLYHHLTKQGITEPVSFQETLSYEQQCQSSISNYIAKNPMFGCVPRPAVIDFDLGKHGEWIKLEAFEEYRNESIRQWGLMNCESDLVLAE